MAGKEMYDGLEGKYIRVFTEEREFIGIIPQDGVHERYIVLNPGTDALAFRRAVKKAIAAIRQELSKQRSDEEQEKAKISIIETYSDKITNAMNQSVARVPLDKIVGILEIDIPNTMSGE